MGELVGGWVAGWPGKLVDGGCRMGKHTAWQPRELGTGPCTCPGLAGPWPCPARERTPSRTPAAQALSSHHPLFQGAPPTTANPSHRPGRGRWGAPTGAPSGGAALAHQVVPADDGQGQRGVAAPQQAGVRSVGEEEPDDVPGTLGGREAEVSGLRGPAPRGTGRRRKLRRHEAGVVARRPGWHGALWMLTTEWWVGRWSSD